MIPSPAPHSQPRDFASYFPPTSGYLSACTGGLPPLETVRAGHAFYDDWSKGALDARAIGAAAERVRGLYAGLAGVPASRVALGSQVSQLVSVVATGVPDGGEVLCPTGDFASLTHPFEQLASRGVTVRYAPAASLAEAITPATSLVAFSLVQSATGEVADHAAIVEAAAAVGAQTCVDLTQSLGWLPVGAADFDYTVCHAYKWLCSPRGTAFLTVREGLDDTLTPLAAGWCSADDVWSSCYAGNTPLSAGTGRFDLSPLWPLIAGTEEALKLFAALDARAVHDHAVALANSAREVLGLPAGNSAIVTWPDPEGADLAAMQAAGLVASGRAGNARVSFHLWNTPDDVDLLARALGR
ncbi:aminotransferase class V-fold PLP-dependent enzyme [Leucobacter aridicollis]|uniref:aminotransferase class V-fold PLP-dependent enzyme n=1 Tax=Leucobacter aridicollis TaxID=283878 RepID=UPI0021043C5B|nr:aminotransferase class V-fold PLP-dependent enzyme [Leucobacter aridicollis]UTX54367.1 aminotransferase class V-fold PLP-dependent enzyme [Leucobacter aridicollis]